MFIKSQQAWQFIWLFGIITIKYEIANQALLLNIQTLPKNSFEDVPWQVYKWLLILIGF